MNKSLKKNINKYKTLLQENRILILNQLLKEETCVCEMVKTMDMPHNLLSHHLKTMYDLGVLSRKKEGLHIKYRIKKGQEEGIKNMISCLNRD